jgi:hypothetical protein
MWALTGLVSAAVLVGYIRIGCPLLLVNEAGLPLLAFLDRWVPPHTRDKRSTSPVPTFLLMNAAALASVAVFVVPAQKLWKPTRVLSQKEPVS